MHVTKDTKKGEAFPAYHSHDGFPVADFPAYHRYVYHRFHAFVSCYVGTEARLSVNLVPQLKDVGCSNAKSCELLGCYVLPRNEPAAFQAIFAAGRKRAFVLQDCPISQLLKKMTTPSLDSCS